MGPNVQARPTTRGPQEALYSPNSQTTEGEYNHDDQLDEHTALDLTVPKLVPS